MAQAANSQIVDHPTPTGTQQDPTHAGMWINNTFYAKRALTDNVLPPTDGAAVRYPVGFFVIPLNIDASGDTTEAFATLLLQTLLNSVAVNLSLHTADPGADGTQNELSGNGYGRATINAGEWTYT